MTILDLLQEGLFLQLPCIDLRQGLPGAQNEIEQKPWQIEEQDYQQGKESCQEIAGTSPYVTPRPNKQTQIESKQVRSQYEQDDLNNHS